MNYIRIRDLLFPCYEGDIRAEHPEIGAQFICPPTFALVQVNPEPAFDPMTHQTQFGVPYQNNGKWMVDLVVVELSDAAKAEKSKKPSEVERNPAIKAIREQIEKELT